MLSDNEDPDDPDFMESLEQGSSKRKNDGEGDTQPKKTARQKAKTFQDKWLTDPQFSGWLARVPSDPNLARCLCCRKDLKGGKSELQKHAKSPIHLKAAKAFKGMRPISQAIATPAKTSEQIHEENVKKMEIGLAAYFAEHNVAFSGADHLLDVIKRGAKDSAIVKDVRLGRLKCAALVRKVVAKTETEELIADLKTCLFSVMIDETTDISNKKLMCILVRYIPPRAAKPRVTLLELVRLDAVDASGEALWQAFLNVLMKYDVPVTNIIGYACDNANVMTGMHNSFWSRLSAACPWAIMLACICHSAALVCRETMKTLPPFVEGHLRNVCSYITGSPKRTAELQNFQELYEVQMKQMLKPSRTRWLVMEPVISRYLENFDCLYGFFRTTVRESPQDRDAAIILSDMRNPFTKAYMLFLSYALTFFNKYNAMFQSRGVMIHKLAESSKRLLRQLCQNFILPSELDRLESTNVAHPSNCISLENIYFGPECKAYLDALVIPIQDEHKKTKHAVDIERKELMNAFRLKCLDFYKKAISEMKKRMPSTKIFEEMAFIDPKVLLSPEARVTLLPDLQALASKFQEKLGLDTNALALEWRTIFTEIDAPLREKLLSMPVEDAWVEIDSLQNFHDEKVFPQLTSLAKCVMCLPHSNADAERAFSIVTDAKTKKRNSLGDDTLNAIVVTRTAFASKGVDCRTFRITTAHLDKFDKSIYQN